MLENGIAAASGKENVLPENIKGNILELSYVFTLNCKIV